MKEIEDLGPTGHTVAANVKRLRESRNLTFARLSELITANGRDMKPLALRRIESRARRVDADDLTALAVALGVSPVTLIMPESGAARDIVRVTGYAHDVGANVAWLWALAREPLGLPDGPGASANSRAIAKFQLESAPDIEERHAGVASWNGVDADAISKLERALDTQGYTLGTTGLDDNAE